MQTVTGALIVRGGRFLICRRRADQPHPLKWEFAGGKAEADEEPPAALRRELQEELGIEAEIGPEVCCLPYQYPGRDPILLIFYRVTGFSGEPLNRAFAEIRWVERGQLPWFDFLEADKELVERIARGEIP
jgi:8-oxo-dGTP diphosphatase